MRIAGLLSVCLAGALAADDKPKLLDGKAGLQGTWTIVSMERGGKKPTEPVTAGTVVFSGNKYVIKAGNEAVEEGMFVVNAKATPNNIDVMATSGEDKGKKWHGVYELEGDTLRAVVGSVDKDRPAALANPAPGTRGFTLKRAKS